MKELGIKGVIINTASVFGFLASPGTFAYHATKGAVIMMSKSARLNWHHMAFALLPLLLSSGYTDYQGYKDSGMLDSMRAKVMGGELTQPEVVADTVYLVSLDEAARLQARGHG